MRNVLEISGEIFKPSLFTLGSPHWTQCELECLFQAFVKAWQWRCTSATFYFHTLAGLFGDSWSFCVHRLKIWSHLTKKVKFSPKMIYNYARALQVGISCKKAFQITSNLLYKERIHSRLYFLRFPALPAFFASLPRSNIPLIPWIPPGALLTRGSTDSPDSHRIIHI